MNDKNKTFRSGDMRRHEDRHWLLLLCVIFVLTLKTLVPWSLTFGSAADSLSAAAVFTQLWPDLSRWPQTAEARPEKCVCVRRCVLLSWYLSHLGILPCKLNVNQTYLRVKVQTDCFKRKKLNVNETKYSLINFKAITLFYFSVPVQGLV